MATLLQGVTRAWGEIHASVLFPVYFDKRKGVSLHLILPLIYSYVLYIITNPLLLSSSPSFSTLDYHLLTDLIAMVGFVVLWLTPILFSQTLVHLSLIGEFLRIYNHIFYFFWFLSFSRNVLHDLQDSLELRSIVFTYKMWCLYFGWEKHWQLIFYPSMSSPV